jgi:predicted TIM-barrel fold metal-dependent hydrolase
VATTLGARGIYKAEVEAALPYQVIDADNHIYDAPEDLGEYLESRYRERAVPPKSSRRGDVRTPQASAQVARTDADDSAAHTLGAHPVPLGGPGGVDLTAIPQMTKVGMVPGTLLNRMNPMKGLDADERERVVAKMREMEPAFEDRDRRLELMDEQGIQAALVHAGGNAHAYAFSQGDVEAGYAAVRGYNRWVQDHWGYAYQNRIFVPVTIPLRDPELAVTELEHVIEEGAKVLNLEAGPAYGRSPFDPIFDGFWARANEAVPRVASHLGTSYVGLGERWGEDPAASYGDLNALQWINYWGDGPIMETVSAMMFHNLFGRFPNIRVCLAEWGTVWAPYLLRKMDHAYMLGRKTKWGNLPDRPSRVFGERVLAAPFPEENVERVAEVIGTDAIVFGSDFPHSEGMPDPIQYVTQLKAYPDSVVQNIMRDNLGDFLGLTTRA